MQASCPTDGREIYRGHLRVSEVVSALSFALDLTEGLPMGHSVRTCVMGMHIASEIGLPPDDQASPSYALMMKDAGDTHDVILMRCDRGASIARRMGLSEQTASAIRSLDEQWDGTGYPAGLCGEEIPLLSRIMNLAQTVEVFHSTRGPRASVEVSIARDGHWFDPDLVRAFRSLANRSEMWTDLSRANETVLTMEPRAEVLEASEETLDRICEVFADVIDAKAPFTYCHSTGVANAAVGIAQTLNQTPEEIRTLRRAALLHDIGKLSVSNAILDKPGKLDEAEWKVVRKHPECTLEILERIPGFGELSEVAAAHHEKLDGSGYFRNMTGDQLNLPARILAVADIYDALAAKRPYRDALPLETVFGILDKDAPKALDAECVEALKVAVKHR